MIARPEILPVGMMTAQSVMTWPYYEVTAHIAQAENGATEGRAAHGAVGRTAANELDPVELRAWVDYVNTFTRGNATDTTLRVVDPQQNGMMGLLSGYLRFNPTARAPNPRSWTRNILAWMKTEGVTKLLPFAIDHNCCPKCKVGRGGCRAGALPTGSRCSTHSFSPPLKMRALIRNQMLNMTKCRKL